MTQIKFRFELAVFQTAFVHWFIEAGGQGEVKESVKIPLGSNHPT